MTYLQSAVSELKNPKEFVAYSLPGTKNYILLQGGFYHIDKLKDTDNEYFILSDFNHQLNDFFRISQSDSNAEISLDSITNLLPDFKGQVKDESDFKGLIGRAIQEIDKGKISKLVLSRISLVDNKIDSLWELFEEVRNAYPDAFVYMLYHRNRGLWLGASPELLLRKTKQGYHTVALAGTLPYSDLSFWDLWTEKEVQEHFWIERHLDDLLNANGIDFIRGDKQTHKAGALAHIRSDYYFNADLESEELAQLIHPGPAISGYPCQEAINWILKNEGHERSLYTGFLGPVTRGGQEELFTNIRCMQIFRNLCALYVGAGITSESIPEKEFAETQQKSATLLRFLNKLQFV